MSLEKTTSRVMRFSWILVLFAGLCCNVAGVLVFQVEDVRPEFMRLLFFMMFWNLSGFIYLNLLVEEIEDALNFILAMQFGPFILLVIIAKHVDWEYWKIRFMARSNLPLYLDKSFSSDKARNLLHRRLRGY